MFSAISYDSKPKITESHDTLFVLSKVQHQLYGPLISIFEHKRVTSITYDTPVRISRFSSKLIRKRM